MDWGAQTSERTLASMWEALVQLPLPQTNKTQLKNVADNLWIEQIFSKDHLDMVGRILEVAFKPEHSSSGNL